MDAGALFREGRLQDAIGALTEEVRKDPMDVDKRAFLAVLLCFSGASERADKQLDALGHLEPGAQAGVSLMRQLVRAEQWRQQFHHEGRVPEFLRRPDARAQLHLSASIHLREEAPDEAARLLTEAEAARPALEGTCDGDAFEDFRDLDDLTSVYLEVLTSTGKFYWIPMEDITEIQFEEPRIPRDLLWRQASMTVRDGPEGVVYLPTVYAGVAADTDDLVRLGRSTEWTGGAGTPARGHGLRTFLVGDEERTILELGALAFSRPEPASD